MNIALKTDMGAVELEEVHLVFECQPTSGSDSILESTVPGENTSIQKGSQEPLLCPSLDQCSEAWLREIPLTAACWLSAGPGCKGASEERNLDPHHPQQTGMPDDRQGHWQ